MVIDSVCRDHVTHHLSANPVTPGGKNNLPKRKTKRSARKRNKTSSSFEAIAEGAEEETLEQVVEETSRDDLESIQPGLKLNVHRRNRSLSREREFSVLKLSASQLQDFKKLAAFEVLDVHMPAKSPHKESNSSPRVAPQSPRSDVLQSPASLPLLPVAIEPSPEAEGVSADQPLVVVAAKRTNASSIRVLRLFERGGKGMFRSQSDSDLNGATPYSFNNPHYQQSGQVSPSHAVTGAKVLVQQRSWNANAFQKYNDIKMKNAARMKGVNMNNTNVNNIANTTHVNGVQSDATAGEVVALTDGLKKFTVQGKKDPRRRQSLPESLPLSPEGEVAFMH